MTNFLNAIKKQPSSWVRPIGRVSKDAMTSMQSVITLIARPGEGQHLANVGG